MEDRAPLDKMVKVCIFSSSPPSPSVEDLRGRLMKVCFNFVNMIISFVEKFNKCYYTVLKKEHQEMIMGFRIFFSDGERGQFFCYNRR